MQVFGGQSMCWSLYTHVQNSHAGQYCTVLHWNVVNEADSSTPFPKCPFELL